MNSFRSIISHYNDVLLCIKVIGYRQVFLKEVHAPAGTDNYFLFLLPKGSWCYLGGRKILLSKSALLLQPPNANIHHGKEQGMIRSWIKFNGEKIESLCCINGIEMNKLYETENPEEHEEHLLGLYREIHHPKGMIPTNINYLFTNWLRSIRRDTFTNSIVPDLRVILAREYMEQNFTKKRKIKDICQNSGLTRNDLCLFFRDYYKTSPMQYVISLRLSLAKELLQNSRLSLEMIAEQSGFSDQYYFSRCFKKHIGITPGQYRKDKQ
jgi:AraC-like DNA-binding protein